jgi:S1-C subfamily serine protease
MEPFRRKKHLAIALAALLPFVVLPWLLARSLGPLARAGAAWWRTVSSSISLSWQAPLQPPNDVLASISLASPDSTIIGQVFELARQSDKRNDGPRGRRQTSRRIFVGPEMIRRAVPLSGRPASSWAARTDDHPAGMIIQSPGVLAGTIRAGDVLTEAEGQPIASLEQLVSIVAKAYERKSKFLSGRLWRRGELWSVTVEPGW